MGIIEFDFKSLNDEIVNSCLPQMLKENQNGRGTNFGPVADFLEVRERRSNFSLESWAILPSAVFGTRRKNVLRGAGYAWTPDLWSFLKLQEVGFSPYLSFIPILSVLSMFKLNKAVRGRLIGPKPWDRIDINF